jgi:hypothetical protein
LGRDPKFCKPGLVRDYVWMSTPEAGGWSAGPTTKFGRVRKKRTVLNIPEREKRVLVKDTR